MNKHRWNTSSNCYNSISVTLILIIALWSFSQETWSKAGTISYGKELSPDSTCTQSDKWDGLRNARADSSGTTINLENDEFSYAYQSDFPNLEAEKPI
jgi:hypothetical protein